ncbi:MAG TPA: hypothetical protein VMG10_04825 [Gemmataceae bacterium]|nr:hypothetical protein [Gemmataceae bacterium]
MPPSLARLLPAILVLAILSGLVSAELRGDDKKAPADPKSLVKGKAAEELVALKLEVDVLEKLYHLELNVKQLSALLKLAEKTAAKMPAVREAQAGVEYRNVLKSLHAALLAEEEDRISELSDKLDELQEKETLSIDDEFEMTDASLLAAPLAFRLLSASQIVAYLAGLDDEVPDPAERILSALEEGEELQGDEWKELRDETAEEVSWLVAGFNMENAAKVNKAVTALLERGHRFQGEELNKQWPGLEKAAHQLVGAVSSLVVLQHYVERELAELLSNPRTAAALRLWIKQSKE